MVDALKGKRAAIIAADDFEDLELFHPMYRLQEEGGEPVVVGLNRTPAKGKKGYTVEPALSIHEADAADFDLLLVPGGKSPETLRLREYDLGFAREIDKQAKPIAAIWHAVQGLSS